jgi:hypothetical protein
MLLTLLPINESLDLEEKKVQITSRIQKGTQDEYFSGSIDNESIIVKACRPLFYEAQPEHWEAEVSTWQGMWDSEDGRQYIPQFHGSGVFDETVRFFVFTEPNGPLVDSLLAKAGALEEIELLLIGKQIFTLLNLVHDRLDLKQPEQP